MALFRCNECSHIREVGSDYIGRSVKCPKCNQITPVHDTVRFVKALIEKHIAQNRALQKLQKNLVKENNPEDQLIDINSFENIDIYNTKVLTQAEKIEPIDHWFKERQIDIQINQEAVDTTGFFDEIALSLGKNFNVLSIVSGQIKYIQNKGYSNVKLDISKKKPEEIKIIRSFCKELYDYSFVVKYFYQKKDKIIRLTLQKAPKIREFFNGVWMEWFTLMTLLEYFRDKNIDASCMRSLDVSFQNGTTNELDIFFLTKNNIPVCIECKSGEFRQDIDKYLKLRKQLKINNDLFVVCVFGLSQEQTQGMTSMYDLTFANENNLIKHIEKIIK